MLSRPIKHQSTHRNPSPLLLSAKETQDYRFSRFFPSRYSLPAVNTFPPSIRPLHHPHPLHRPLWCVRCPPEVGRISEECSEPSLTHTNGKPCCSRLPWRWKPSHRNTEGESDSNQISLIYAQPFIRYNLADLGMKLDEKCSCGLHFPFNEANIRRVERRYSSFRGSSYLQPRRQIIF